MSWTSRSRNRVDTLVSRWPYGGPSMGGIWSMPISYYLRFFEKCWLCFANNIVCIERRVLRSVLSARSRRRSHYASDSSSFAFRRSDTSPRVMSTDGPAINNCNRGACARRRYISAAAFVSRIQQSLTQWASSRLRSGDKTNN